MSSYFSSHLPLRKFTKANQVFKHVYDDHVFGPPSTPIMSCLWGSNEGTGPGCQSKRPRLSLLTHLQVSILHSTRLLAKHCENC